MIRAALLFIALVNVIWYAQGSRTPALNLEAALLDVTFAVVLDVLDRQWKRARA